MGVIFSPAIIHLANHDASVRQHALRTGMKTPLVSQAVVFSISLCVSCIGFTLIFGKSPGILEGCLIVPLSLVLAPKVQNLIQKIVKR